VKQYVLLANIQVHHAQTVIESRHSYTHTWGRVDRMRQDEPCHLVSLANSLKTFLGCYW